MFDPLSATVAKSRLVDRSYWRSVDTTTRNALIVRHWSAPVGLLDVCTSRVKLR